MADIQPGKSKKYVVTWFHADNANSAGTYSQVRGVSSSETFKDVYRRCLYTFFYSAKLANPDAILRLYVNQPLSNRTPTESVVTQLLVDLGVEIKLLAYKSNPPSTFTRAWRNQFYLLDVIEDLSSEIADIDLVTVLDSDIVWTGADSTAIFWEELRQRTLLTYQIGYDRNLKVNGLSEADLENLYLDKDQPPRKIIRYAGGEFVACSGKTLRDLTMKVGEISHRMFSRHNLDHSFVFEEAHILSLAYSSIPARQGDGSAFIKRIWTQPLKPRNTTPSDVELTMWHVPAEKRYGLRRLFLAWANKSKSQENLLSAIAFKQSLGQYLGIPRNSILKWVKDVSYSAATRFLQNALMSGLLENRNKSKLND